MLPMPIQFIIAMIAYAINERMALLLPPSVRRRFAPAADSLQAPCSRLSRYAYFVRGWRLGEKGVRWSRSARA